jgi:hypothetical protein
MMRPLRKFLGLTPRRRRLLVRAALLLGAIQLGLRLLPFQQLLGLLARGGRTTPPDAVEAIAWAVAVASCYVPGAHTCLPRALAAQALLARHG